MAGENARPFNEQFPKPWMHRYGWIVAAILAVIIVSIFSVAA